MTRDATSIAELTMKHTLPAGILDGSAHKRVNMQSAERNSLTPQRQQDDSRSEEPISASQAQQRLLTRGVDRQQNQRESGELAETKAASRKTGRTSTLPRRAARKRQDAVGPPARVQPKRNARKKGTQEKEIIPDTIPRIKSEFFAIDVLDVDLYKVVPALSQRLEGAVTAETQTHPSKQLASEPTFAKHSSVTLPSAGAKPQSQGVRNFEENLPSAVLQDKVKKYEKSLVSMIAERERVTEAIAMKEEHIKTLEHVLHGWATATMADRCQFGDYSTEEAIQHTLLTQTESLPPLQGSHNALGYEIETVKLRMCMAWETIETAEAHKKRS